MVNLRNAAATNRALHVFEDAAGRHELVPDEPELEPEQKPDDPNPELRAVLNAFSEKHGLGALQVTPGRYGSELGEIMQDGAVHPLGTLFGNDNGKPFTPDTLQKSLDSFEQNRSARGEEISDAMGRKQMLEKHGGAVPLPEVQKDLPEIFYADSPSMRISNNISAIREMLRLEQAERDGTEPYDPRSNQYNSRQNSEGRLRQYCGWGGLPQVFDERFPQYDHYRKELQKMMSPEEYAAARASTMNAHYTPQIIIDAMYKAVQSMGLSRDSRILEPSCGTGNFISRMPHSIGQGGVVGVELDSITARIAAQLNKQDPNVRIIESGFEHADLQNNSFDLAIGNIPFGNYNLNDPDYTQDWLIHDAFFRRALDKVAPGGVVAFVTSSGTLDKTNPKVREYLAERADLIGAIRLPNTAFRDAGTKVTSDIIFLQKRAEPLQPFDRKPDWCYTTPNADGLRINSYFVQNPQMVLGTMRQTSYYDTLTCDPIEDADFAKQLDDAVQHLNAKITIIKREQAAQQRRGMVEPWGKNFTYQIKDGKANAIKAAFKEWIFADPERKAKYERRYNDIFNSLVGREYDGSKLTFDGLASDFVLRPHQKDCVARAIYGGNTLAAHVVGAGKSAVMFSTVMKKKALGLISKACVVVPKPLTEQVAREWRSIYPDARLLVVTNDDLSTDAKRNLFTARVATGSYDAVIMSQEQFEKIPMSRAYRTEFLMKELDSLEDMLREKKLATGGKRDYSVKAIERAKKQLAAKIEKLTNAKGAAKAKDDLLEFEHLGFDYLVVDEAHAYKNGFVTTKMTNVAGVTTRPSGRAEDMQMKTDYFNDHLGQGHLLFCTGTPYASPYQH